MSDEIKVQSKNTKTKLIIAVAAVVIAVLTIVAIVLVSSNGATAKKVKEQISLGDKYLSELQYEQAIAAYELAIEIDPKCEDAYLALAEIYIETGEFEKAEEILDKAEEALGKETKGIKALREKLQEDSEVDAPNDSSNIPSFSGNVSVTQDNQGLTFGVFKYEVMEDGNIRIIGLVDKAVTELTIPGEIEGKVVTEIGEYAFSHCEKLKSIIIQEGVIKICNDAIKVCEVLEAVLLPQSLSVIGERAFYSSDSLESITIPGNVKEIGKKAFGNCSNLKEIQIQNGVEQIGESAFENCGSLESVVIPGTVKDIGKNAFSICTKLNDIKLQNGIERIGESTFYACYSLTRVVLPDSIKSIGDMAFSSCRKLVSLKMPDNKVAMGVNVFNDCNEKLVLEVDEQNTHYTLVDGVVFSKDMTELVYMPKSVAQKNYDVPEGVVSIGNSVFYDCDITTITLPNSLVHIGEEAFVLTSVYRLTLPENIASIGRRAFAHTIVTRIDVSSSNKYFTSIDGVVFSKDKTKLVQMPGMWIDKYLIPSGVKIIGECAFFSGDLVEVVLPNSVEVIEKEAFGVCLDLERIWIPESVKTIAEDAFWLSSDVMIITPAGSYAESYALNHGIPVKNE